MSRRGPARPGALSPPRVYDVSQPVAPGIPVWPGDPPYEAGWAWRIRDGAPCNVGRLALGCHTGTHIDAPYHFAEAGVTVERIPLDACIGPAVVVPLAQLADARAERVLVRSGGAPVAAATIERLAGLRLLGTDAASVDPPDAETLEAHHALWRRGAVILEGLDLSAVPDGPYQLVALPLRLVGMDASPVRAVLVANPG